MQVFNAIGSWFHTALVDGWNWCNSLSYQEWFLFLGMASCMGFLCMRGYGSRSNY